MRFNPETIPAELKTYKQWVVVATGKVPMKWTGTKFVKVDPAAEVSADLWMTFDDAVTMAHQNDFGIGFVLTADDPFCIIDLDTKDSRSLSKDGSPCPPALYTQPSAILDLLNPCISTFAECYAEVSTSGRGVHIVGKANIGAGRRKYGIEIYSQQRYMIFTGDTGNDLMFSNYWTGERAGEGEYHVDLLRRPSTVKPMLDIQVAAQGLADWLSSQTTGVSDKDLLVEDLPEVFNDEELFRRCVEGNGDKFLRLCNGDKSDYGNDWSIADSGLIEMLCYYSGNEAQVERCWRSTMLADRDKANRPDYFRRTYVRMRNIVYKEECDKEAHADIISDAVVAALNTRLVAAQTAAEDAMLGRFSGLLEQMEQRLERINNPAPRVAEAPPQPHKTAEPVANTSGLEFLLPYMDGGDRSNIKYVARNRPEFCVPWPAPTTMGLILEDVIRHQNRPIREIALATTLGFMSGLMGRAYLTPTNAGLNQYIMMVAESGTGKDGMHKSAARLATICRSVVPEVDRFIVGEPPSSEGIIASLLEHPCHVSYQGEMAKTLRQLTDPRGGNPVKAGIAKEQLEMYTKSDAGQIKAAKRRSKKEDSTPKIIEPSLSICGEGTPFDFFSALTRALMEDGYLSRFTAIVYDGPVPDLNLADPNEPMDPRAADALRNVAAQAWRNIRESQGLSEAEIEAMTRGEKRMTSRTQVQWTYDAANMLGGFSKMANDLINGKQCHAQMKSVYNRCYIKALKIASICAVLDNPYQPVINSQHARYGIDVSMAMVNTFQYLIDKNMLGTTSEAQLATIAMDAMNKFVGDHQSIVPYTNGIDESKMPAVFSLLSIGVVPLAALKRVLFDAGVNDSRRFDEIIRGMMADGSIMEARNHATAVGFAGKCVISVKQ